MFTDRQVQEAIAQAVSIMVGFHGDGRNPHCQEVMAAEVQVLTGWIFEAGLKPEEVERRILRAIGDELVARYGHEVGPRLNAEFLAVFDGAYEACRRGEVPELQDVEICGGGRRLTQ